MAEIKDMTGSLGGGRMLMRFNGVPSGAGIFQQETRLNDAAQGLFEEFTSVETQVTEDFYTPQDGLKMCPLKDDLAFGTKRVKGYLTSSMGEPKMIDGVNPEIGRVSSEAGEMIEEAITLGLGYEIDINALAAAPRGGEEWDRVRTLDRACDRGLMERIDKVLVNGDSSLKARALFADKTQGTGTYKLLGGGGGHHLRDESGDIIHLTNSSTSDELADNLLLALQRIYEKTEKQIRPNRLALPLRLRNKCERKRLTDTGQSVLSYIVANSPYLASEDDIIGVPALEGFFPAKGGKTARDAIIPYHFDPMTVRTRILSARRHSVQQFPFGQLVIWAARFHPALWWRPMGCQIFENDYNYVAS